MKSLSDEIERRPINCFFHSSQGCRPGGYPSDPSLVRLSERVANIDWIYRFEFLLQFRIDLLRFLAFRHLITTERQLDKFTGFPVDLTGTKRTRIQKNFQTGEHVWSQRADRSRPFVGVRHACRMISRITVVRRKQVGMDMIAGGEHHRALHSLRSQRTKIRTPKYPLAPRKK